jgi:Ni/Co efflux regulator RcnB
MKKILLAALAPASLVAALGFSPAAFADNVVRPAPFGPLVPYDSGPRAKYNGDPESQLAFEADQRRRNQYAPYAYGYGVPDWQAREWQRRGLEAAPRGYRWQRYGDRYALIRRSDGAVVQWR